MLANAEPDIAKQDEIDRQGLREFPASAELMGNYALFMEDKRKDYDAAEAMYEKELELDPKNPNRYANLASIKLLRGDLRSLEVVPSLVRQGLLAIGYERKSWDFDPVFAVTLPKRPPARQAFYRSLGAAVLDSSKVALLDGFADWHSLESMDPFAPLGTP